MSARVDLPAAVPRVRALRHDPLVRAVRLLEVPWRRVALAVVTGVGALGSAVALAAVSAWLIARASQMPPVLTLSVAAVAVRTFGITRGVLRYLERLGSHDLALGGMATLRARCYARLAQGPSAHLAALRRGDLLARVGADVDAIGDVVVRSLLPALVAAGVGLVAVGVVGAFLPSAAIALAACLLLAGVAGPATALVAARAAEEDAADARAEISATALTLLDGAAELAVAGRADGVLTDLAAAERAHARATDRSARIAALAAAANPLATGLAVLAALVLGVPATTAGVLDPVELAVVVLTPLAAFEATSVLPTAATGALRSRAAAARVLALLDGAGRDPDRGDPVPSPAPGDAPAPAAVRPGAAASGATRPTLTARDLTCAWPGHAPVLSGVDLEVAAGRSLVVVGPSGSGKTTLLLTLAGMLPPAAGEVRCAGVEPARLARADAAALVSLTTEDAHVFDTTVLENLRVARGDVTPTEAWDVLDRVGLGAWVRALPHGLDTLLGSDASRVSGGERRRLLLARALLSPAPFLLLDEPTEHVDAGAGQLLASLLDGTLAPGRGVVVVTHRTDGAASAGEVVHLGASAAGAAPRTVGRERAAG